MSDTPERDTLPDADRRRLLLAGVAGVTALAAPSIFPASSRAAPAPIALPGMLRRIAFGSCADQDKPQPIWDAILAAEPDLYIGLGDNIYGDTRDMSVLAAKYAKLAAIPGFKRLRERVPMLATWDDHDFGENDAGGDYPMKRASQQIFCDFWGEGADSPRRTRDGIYTALTVGPPGRRVQIVLPDLRFNRSPMTRNDMDDATYRTWAKARVDAGQEAAGFYLRNPAYEASMLGETQWRWLEQALAEPAEFRVFASSLQVLADFPGWEAWANFPRDLARLIEVLRRTRAEGLVMISGDTHYAELSRLDLNVPYPLWDLTSSGLTEVWGIPTPNANRMSEALNEPNFGLIEIDWEEPRRISLQIRDGAGRVRIEQRIEAAALRAGA
ncbi:MAG: alkaline phosphatase D family protein [Gammaproteobacteria bacterium]